MFLILVTLPSVDYCRSKPDISIIQDCNTKVKVTRSLLNHWTRLPVWYNGINYAINTKHIDQIWWNCFFWYYLYNSFNNTAYSLLSISITYRYTVAYWCITRIHTMIFFCFCFVLWCNVAIFIQLYLFYDGCFLFHLVKNWILCNYQCLQTISMWIMWKTVH